MAHYFNVISCGIKQMHEYSFIHLCLFFICLFILLSLLICIFSNRSLGTFFHGFRIPFLFPFPFPHSGFIFQCCRFSSVCGTEGIWNPECGIHNPFPFVICGKAFRIYNIFSNLFFFFNYSSFFFLIIAIQNIMQEVSEVFLACSQALGVFPIYPR